MIVSKIYCGNTPITWVYRNGKLIWTTADYKTDEVLIDSLAEELDAFVLACCNSSSANNILGNNNISIYFEAEP